MEETKMPFVRSTKDSRVIWADDVVFTKSERYLEISINAIEEIPKDEDDITLGTKENTKNGYGFLLKSQIVALDWGYCNSIGCYDISIYTSAVLYAYNCESKAVAIRVYNDIKEWLLA